MKIFRRLVCLVKGHKWKYGLSLILSSRGWMKEKVCEYCEKSSTYYIQGSS